MKRYFVNVREVHISIREVVASSQKEAIEKVDAGEGEALDGLEFSHTLAPEYWTVDEDEEVQEEEDSE